MASLLDLWNEERRKSGGGLLSLPLDAISTGVKAAWGSLPQNVRETYASAPEGAAEVYGAVSTPGAIRDTVTALGDTTKSALAGEGWDIATNLAKAATAAVGVVPGAALVTKGAKKIGKGLLREAEVMPELADRYPTAGVSSMKTDARTGEPFRSKDKTPEEERVSKARATIQKDIDEGKYTPYFDPSKRFDVDPSKYDPRFDTTTLRKVKPETQAKYDAIANDPAAMQRLDEAYEQGMKQMAGSKDWYMMGQLEKEYIKEHGAKMGRVLFKERFADAMAATTTGMTPQANFITASYGNYMKNKGLPLPPHAWDVPTPVGGGKYGVGPNLKQYDKMIVKGEGNTPDNPKRYNFAGNFLGNRNNATIDEQMMKMIDPKGPSAPPDGSYGHYEGGVVSHAKGRGIDPVTYQEVGWAGKKDLDTLAKSKGKQGFVAQPMIEVVNESIERTSRLTGLPPAEVVRRMVRGEMPMYGVAGAGAIGAGGLLSGQPDPDRQQY